MFGTLLVTLATWLLVGCAAWAALIAGAVLVEAGSRGRLRWARQLGCPPGLHRALLTGLGALLAVGGTAQASLATDGQDAGPTRLPTPARPAGHPVGPPAHPHARPAALGDHLVVRAGDCLWQLARARLPADASSARVAELVRAIHERNLGVIGTDPDLIRPGQRLAVPPPSHPSPEE